MEKFYIVDAANLLFRSYYAIGFMTNPQGESTGAIFGFVRSILKLIKDFNPTHLVVVFDGPNNKQSRQAIYEHYKSHRKGMPEDLFPQMQWAADFCEAYGIPVITVDGVEADDTIGSLAKWVEEKNGTAYLCSADKDLCQLVSENVFVVNLAKDNLLIDKHKVKEIYGVTPEQIVDLLALMGDSSDNIPGLEGIGPKTAVQLIEEFGSLDNLLQNADKLTGKKATTVQEGKEIAKLSYKLATIDCHIPFEKNAQIYLLHPPNLELLKPFYQKMHFLSLLKEIDAVSEKTPSETRYTTLRTEEALHELEEALAKEKTAVIDTETTGLSTMEAEVVGLSFCFKEGEAMYVPLNAEIPKEKVLEILRRIIQNPSIEWIGHNIKYDKHVLENEKIFLSHIYFDTMIASYLLTPHNPRHNLDALSLENFGKVKIPIEELIGKGKNEITMKEVAVEKVSPYACEDADYTLRLKNRFEKALKEKNLFSVFEKIEMPLIPVLFGMERRGVYVDTAYLERLSIEFRTQIERLTQEIYVEAGEEFNISSPKQLSVVLFEKMKIPAPKKTATGFSTAIDVLESLQETVPFVKKVMVYRSLEKLRSTYVDALIQQTNPITHRIHCHFNQSVAATGRLSSQDPNLQNIPVRSTEGKKIRHAFKPQESGWSFLSADYSQIELRLLAHMSEDPSLLQAFHEGEDIHTFTASQVFDVPLKEVTPEMRYKAKAVNFGVLYGQQAFGLSQGLNLDYKEAQAFINRYFARYHRVKEFLESCKEFVRKNGYSVTLTGRQRPIPEINSKNGMIRSAAERLAVNTPLQGSQADIIKMAMIRIDQALQEKPIGFMLIQIHDALLFETPDHNLPALSTLVKEHMEGVMKLKVPLTVDISIGKNWEEC